MWKSGPVDSVTSGGTDPGTNGSRRVTCRVECNAAITARCDRTAPFAFPVVPDVNNTTAGSASFPPMTGWCSGRGQLRCCSARPVDDLREGERSVALHKVQAFAPRLAVSEDLHEVLRSRMEDPQRNAVEHFLPKIGSPVTRHRGYRPQSARAR